MDKVYYLLNEANKNLRTADHLVYMTYPLIKDPKLLKSIADNLHRALIYGMDAIVRYEQLYKRLPMTTNFEVKYDGFKKKCVPKYNLNKDLPDMIKILNKATSTKEVRVSIVKRDLRSNGETLSYDQVKNMTNKTKTFLIKLNSVVAKR